MENIVLNRKCILTPVKGCSWASEMVLNPGMVKDPDTGRIHMLVRTTGPFPEKKSPDKPMPFPIFMAYGYSDDDGKTFSFDFENPAFEPKLETEAHKIYVTNAKCESVPDYLNGCAEDPRMFYIEGECYCVLCGRTFPPGPYWENDEPTQCMPEWALKDDSPIGNQKNATVSVLFKVNLKALADGDYDNALTYVADLTDPEKGEDRDVFIFPKKMKIDGKMQYIMIHRPYNPSVYDGISETRPSIMISAAEDLCSFAKGATRRELLYAPRHSWQGNRVGASAPAIKLSDGEWLLNFHGKENDVDGYAQSFMILKEKEDSFPEISHLYPKKWIVDEEDFELPNKFKTHCVFFTGIVQISDKLLVSYGAADENAAVMELDFKKLENILRTYPYTANN